MSECGFKGNLRSRGIYLRYGVAIISAISVGILAGQIHSGQILGWWRGFLWVPLFFFFLGVLQAKEKTCAFMALQGIQDCEGGVCPLQTELKGQARQAGLWLLARAAVCATGLCALFLWLLG